MMPLQYIDKKAYFMDLELNVTPDAFIPRPETELVVEKTLELIARGRLREPRILDIGTGSGNIAIGLTKYLKASKITALDISAKALEIAKENAVNCGCLDRIDFIPSDIFSALDNNTYKNYFDIIVSNPPYVSEDEMGTLQAEVMAEPMEALYGGKDGLDFYRRIVKDARLYLKRLGFIIFEAGYNQARAVKAILEKADFRDIEIFKDYSGIERIVSGWTN